MLSYWYSVLLSEEIKKAWESVKSIRTNLKEMGLAYDANKAVQNEQNEMLGEDDTEKRETSSDHEDKALLKILTKDHVMRTLEADAKAPRERLLRLPKGQTQFLTYLIKKYDEDYEVKCFCSAWSICYLYIRMLSFLFSLCLGHVKG